MFGLFERYNGTDLTSDDMEWYTAALLTLSQAALLSNSLAGHKVRAQGQRAGDAVLASRPRQAQTPVQVRETQARSFAGNFLWRLAKDALWSTFVLPIYAIPVIGQLLYMFIRAPNITDRYLSMFASKDIVNDYRFVAIGFGMVAGLLSNMPFIGHFFAT